VNSCRFSLEAIASRSHLSISASSSPTFDRTYRPSSLFGTIPKLYETHIPTNIFSKLLLTVGSSLVAMSDPSRDDMIATLGETTGFLALQRMRDTMLKDPVGSRILEEKPFITEKTINFEHLKSLPQNTFGASYAQFMSKRGFTPDDRSSVHYVDDLELAFVMQRYRQVHDFWHVLAGMPTTVLGEIAVKWLEMVQTQLPMTALSSFVAPLRLSQSQREKLRQEMVPWAIRCGNNCVNLMNVYYEKHFEVDLDEFRKQLNFEPF